MDEIADLSEYYRRTAERYDEMHLGDAAHEFALALMTGLLDHLSIKSVLDVGSGTGRAVLGVKANDPSFKIVGVEPSDRLREMGYKKGIRDDELIDGDAYSLPFDDKSFDLVCAFGIMHHLEDPEKAALEMVRVARRAIFISDHNDYGRGSALTTTLKQAAKETGLWWLCRLLITRGKGYRITDDDGLWYPYSIFDTHKVLLPHCSKVHFLSTLGSGPNLYRSASHVAMLGLL
jgi:SAM-dependent methyltransferase